MVALKIGEKKYFLMNLPLYSKDVELNGNILSYTNSTGDRESVSLNPKNNYHGIVNDNISEDTVKRSLNISDSNTINAVLISIS